MNVSEKNKQSVLASAIVAKATVRRENGRTEIIVVFQESTIYEFYWVFSARGPRSARKSWKYTCHYGRDFNLADKPYRDFGTFVAHYAGIKHAQVLNVRVLHARRMASLLTKTAHGTIHADWTPQDKSKLTAANFQKVQKKADAAFSLGGLYAARRDRQYDDIPQDPNSVLVYDDYCEECNTRHAFAHFPSGKRQCKLGYSEMRKHPGFDYRGFTPTSGFKFTYRSAVLVPAGA